MAWQLDIENVAGIRSATTTLEPGISAVRGTNWQGKSSFITAVETVMGTETDLTEGETTGRVTLRTDTETVTVRLDREDGRVTRRGEPYLTSEKTRVAAGLYAFLDDANPVRTAVANAENLETVLTRPLDFENIDERISQLTHERDQVERELELAEDAADDLADAQATVTELEAELEEARERRAAMGASDEQSVSQQREELSELKAERDSTEQRIERLERSVERTRAKLSDRRDELDAIEVPQPDEDLESKIEAKQDRLERLERDAELLQSVYAPTKRILDEDRLDLITDVDRDVMADTVSCWTCGADATREDLRANLEAQSERIAELRSRATEYERAVSDLQERRAELDRAATRKADLEAEVAELDATLEERESSLDRARERLDSLEGRIDDLSTTVEDQDAELTDLESQIKYTEKRLADARETLETLESRASRRDQLRSERDELTDEIHSLRDRKDRLKRQTREAFDAAIRDVLSRFDVGFEMVRLTPAFDLVVARDGREASLDALSEGELELLGIVAALAGYEAFDVTDDIPVMLLDGLGGLADDNLRTLVEFLDDRAEFLVFTSHPENTAFEDHTIDPGEWTVVSPETGPGAE